MSGTCGLWWHLSSFVTCNIHNISLGLSLVYAALVGGQLMFMGSPTHCSLHCNFDFTFIISCTYFLELLCWEPNIGTYCLASVDFWNFDAWLHTFLLLQFVWIQNQNHGVETTNFSCHLLMLSGPLLWQSLYPLRRWLFSRRAHSVIFPI